MDLIKTSAEAMKLRLLNAFMLATSYTAANDHERTVRFLSEATAANLYLPSLLNKLAQT